MTQDELQNEFMMLRDEAIRLRQTVNTFNALFDSDPETEQILRESAGLFFDDLNVMMQEYAILLICRLTGPAKSFGKANLSTRRFTELMQASGRLTPEIETEIERLDEALREYGELLKPARDKLIAHSDLKVRSSATALGGHSKERMVQFLEDLQKYFDAVGDAVGVGPSDFQYMPGSGDVIDLIAKLKKANDPARK